MPRHLNRFSGFPQETKTAKAVQRLFVGPITAEQIYVNQKVSDLISKAEMEQNDYRRGKKPNVFFGLQKRYFGISIGVFTFNTVVLIASMLGLLVLLHWILRKQLEVVRRS